MTRLTKTTTTALLAALTLTLALAPAAMAQDDTETPKSGTSKEKTDTSDKAEFSALMDLVRFQAYTVFDEIRFSLRMAEKHAAAGDYKQAKAWRETAENLQDILNDLVQWYFKLLQASETNDMVAQEMAQAGDTGDVQEPGTDPQADPKLDRLRAEYELLSQRLAKLTAEYAAATAGKITDKGAVMKLAEAVRELQARVDSLAKQIAERG